MNTHLRPDPYRWMCECGNYYLAPAPCACFLCLDNAIQLAWEEKRLARLEAIAPRAKNRPAPLPLDERKHRSSVRFHRWYSAHREQHNAKTLKRYHDLKEAV